MTGGALGSHRRAVLSPDRGGAQDAAGGRRGRGHVGHLRHAGRGGAAGGRAAAVRMEAAQRDPGGPGQRDRGRGAALHSRAGSAVPGAAARRSSSARRDLLGCVVAGLLAGGLSALLTLGVYAAEDAFPETAHSLDVVAGDRRPRRRTGRPDLSRRRWASATTPSGALLQGDVPRTVIAGVLLVKSAIWIISLGSGTSGGVLAPLLMMGAALGGVEGDVPAARRRRLLAAGQHGRDSGRHHAGAVHRDSVSRWN